MEDTRAKTMEIMVDMKGSMVPMDGAWNSMPRPSAIRESSWTR